MGSMMGGGMMGTGVRPVLQLILFRVWVIGQAGREIATTYCREFLLSDVGE